MAAALRAWPEIGYLCVVVGSFGATKFRQQRLDLANFRPKRKI